MCLLQVRHFEEVDCIEEEGEAVGESLSSFPVPWHLDRLDQATPHLDNSYQPIGMGEGVDIYVLDSGVNYNHSEFEYRAKYAGEPESKNYFRPAQKLYHPTGFHILCA